MSVPRLAQLVHLARSNAHGLSLSQYGCCSNVCRWFSQESSGDVKNTDPKPRRDATKATKHVPPVESQDALNRENQRLAAESAAQSVTASMFPWERRQMDGGGTPLNRFERVYWVAFGGAVAFIAGSNIYRYFTSKKEVVIDEDLTKKKEDMAMKLSSGSVNVLQCEDVFEGLTPEEVSDFVDSARNKKIRERHSQADEYDGLSPEEINKLQQ